MIITVICVLGGVLVRFLPLIQEYIYFDKISVEELSASDTNYPYLYQARRTLYIDPTYKTVGDEIEDTSLNIISTYLACYQNKNILEPLIEKYYKEAAVLATTNQENQVKYQFITSASKTNFELSDFYKMLEVRSINNRLVSIYAKTPDSDFSEALVSDFEKLISAEVKNIAGDFTYTLTEGQIGISLPVDTTGVVIKPDFNTEIRKKPSISFIIKRSVKGGIWGLGLGIAISLLWGFFYFSVSQVIYEVEDLKAFQVPVLAVFTETCKRKGKLDLQNKLIAFLRGESLAFCDYATGSSVVQEMLRQNENINTDTIAVTGSCSDSTIAKITEALNEASQSFKFIFADDIVYSADALKKLESIKYVLLVEKLNASSKVEIHRELENLLYLKKSAIGFIVVQ